MDINLFDFTSSKNKFSSSETDDSKKRQKRRTKKQAIGQQEKIGGKVTSAKRKSKNTSSSIRCKANDSKVKPAEEAINGNILQESLGDIAEKAEQISSQAKTLSDLVEDDVNKSPRRVGLLREKILRLAPSNDLKNTFNQPANTLPSVPTLSVEAATESENESESAADTDVAQPHSKGDDKSNYEVRNNADSQGEEEVLPDSSGGICTTVRNSQNSKYELNGLTTKKSF